jgi:hypothetical protein
MKFSRRARLMQLNRTFWARRHYHMSCNAMAHMDSLECLGYWDLDNLVVNNRGIYTS